MIVVFAWDQKEEIESNGLLIAFLTVFPHLVLVFHWRTSSSTTGADYKV